jgi:hypothetical protein
VRIARDTRDFLTILHRSISRLLPRRVSTWIDIALAPSVTGRPGGTVISQLLGTRQGAAMRVPEKEGGHAPSLPVVPAGPNAASNLPATRTCPPVLTQCGLVCPRAALALGGPALFQGGDPHDYDRTAAPAPPAVRRRLRHAQDETGKDAWNTRDRSGSPWPTPRTASGGTARSSSRGGSGTRSSTTGSSKSCVRSPATVSPASQPKCENEVPNG